jgi:putative membrane protein
MNIKEFFFNFCKGVGMGAANVIPGVSGGTIAFITGIFERLINAIKSFNITALKLLFTGKLKAFARHIDLSFLLSVGAGIAVAIITVAKLFHYLFEHYPIYLWSFFLGLVLISVFYVAKEVSKWNFTTVALFVLGTGIAVSVALLKPGNQNDSILYLLVCGAIAACSMILPGLSGSFVLILMGNYQLVMIDAVNDLAGLNTDAFRILIPVIIGAVVGLLGFSYFLSWLFKKYRNQAISVLSGFILGSSMMLYPWKQPVTEQFGDSVKVVGYDWYFPAVNSEAMYALLFIVLGGALIWAMESIAKRMKKEIKR